MCIKNPTQFNQEVGFGYKVFVTSLNEIIGWLYGPNGRYSSCPYERKTWYTCASMTHPFHFYKSKESAQRLCRKSSENGIAHKVFKIKFRKGVTQGLSIYDMTAYTAQQIQILEEVGN